MSYAYFVEDLFPRHRTSLLCGPSGAGKSRWLLPMIADWQEGKPILGKQSYPDACCYIAGDRPSEATYELIDRMGLNRRLEGMPIYSLMDENRSFNWQNISFMIGPQPRVLFIEAFQVLIPQGELNKYWNVLNFFREWNQECYKRKWSVFGTCHQPKMREGEGYILARDKIMGGAAWGAATEGILTLDYSQPALASCPLRHMTVLPRNFPSWSIELEFNSRGFLVGVQQDYVLADLVYMIELQKLPDGTAITTAQIRSWGQSKGISDSTLYRWIKACKHLKPMGKRGCYIYMEEPEEPPPTIMQ